MASVGVKRRYRRPTSKKQKIWEYMRRNKTFRVGDIMALVEVTQGYLKPLLWHLEKAAYLRLSADTEQYKDRIYVMIKDTGPTSPSIAQGDVYDHNAKELIKVRSDRSASKTGGSYLKLLKAMTQDTMTREEIAKAADVKARSGSTGRCLQHMSLEGIITDAKKKRDGKKLYRIDKVKRAEKILEMEKAMGDVEDDS